MKNKLNPISIKNAVFICAIHCFALLIGCKKYITVDTPPTSVSTESAFKNDAGAIQVVTGLFSFMGGSNGNGTYVSTSVLPELSADNLSLYDRETYRFSDYYKNALESQYLNSAEGDTYWAISYKQLYTINTAIERLKGNTELTPIVAKRLLGEAYFLRALYYFYLVNFYGEVPLVISTDYETNSRLAKSASAVVYAQIEADLAAAEGLLDPEYYAANLVTPTSERLRPNRFAVNALQARVFLYERKFSEAEAAATKVITESTYALSDVNAAFLANSSETIWALQPVTTGYNTYEGSIFNLPPSGPDGNLYGGFPFYASKSLVESFKPGDARKSNWLGMVTADNVDYYYPSKYKVPFILDSKDLQEYTIVLRLSEQYLIRAEARNEQGRSSDAISDINLLREKRRAAPSTAVPNPLPPLASTLNQTQLRSLIMDERRFELFTEGGHRWFDLRRSGTIDQVLTKEEQEKGGTWAAFKVLYPIPRYDLTSNTNLAQTPGYAK